MQGQTVRIVSHAIRYIEEHLHEKMDLDMVASALHYSQIPPASDFYKDRRLDYP